MHNILIMTNTTPVEHHKSEEISLDCEIAAPQPLPCGWFGSAKKLRDLEKFKHMFTNCCHNMLLRQTQIQKPIYMEQYPSLQSLIHATRNSQFFT